MWFKKAAQWDQEYDVVIVGSGGAGITAAIVAHDAGASVAIVEKAKVVGGTTAVSGGVVWVPNNHHMSEVGIEDSREDAFRYLTRLADGRSNEDLIELFLDTAPKMILYLEDKAGLEFKSLERYPDYHPEFDGGRPGGRSLDPGLFNTNELGEHKSKLRRSPIFGMTAMTVAEATEWGVFSNPAALPFKLLGERFQEGLVCYGGSLMGRMFKALIDRNIMPMTSTAAKELIVEDDRVAGILVENEDQTLRIGAKHGVVLASGGFEWSKELNVQFLAGQLTHPNSPPGNDGDGLRMAMSVGADLANMSEAWWCPSVVIPDEQYDGVQLNRGDFATRSLPHSIIVNRKGRRFVNEAHNYNDMMKPFFDFDPVDYERPNLPAWLVFDQAYMNKYALQTYVPGMPVPKWVIRADTLEDLAKEIEVDVSGLNETVKRFNGFAVEGVDKDFRRGESLYDHFYGDPNHKPNPNLGEISEGPFYALQIHPGAIGTKGGAKINDRSQVIRVNGEVIEGLYAAGNVMAGITGPGYPGAGGTIGAAMTFGFIAGRDLARKVGEN